MNDKGRLALLKSARADLHKTREGYVTHPNGPWWELAEGKLDKLQKDLAAPAAQTLVFPIAADPSIQVFVGGLHETGGLPGYWALDFICHAGLGMCAPEAGVVRKFSGNDPSDDDADAQGVYGWTTYILTPAGYDYMITHQGRRYPTLRVGMKVQPGDLIGFVGDQRFRPDHAHVAVHSPKGTADAKARITAVSKAPRVS